MAASTRTAIEELLRALDILHTVRGECQTVLKALKAVAAARSVMSVSKGDTFEPQAERFANDLAILETPGDFETQYSTLEKVVRESQPDQLRAHLDDWYEKLKHLKIIGQAGNDVREARDGLMQAKGMMMLVHQVAETPGIPEEAKKRMNEILRADRVQPLVDLLNKLEEADAAGELGERLKATRAALGEYLSATSSLSPEEAARRGTVYAKIFEHLSLLEKLIEARQELTASLEVLQGLMSKLKVITPETLSEVRSKLKAVVDLGAEALGPKTDLRTKFEAAAHFFAQI